MTPKGPEGWDDLRTEADGGLRVVGEAIVPILGGLDRTRRGESGLR